MNKQTIYLIPGRNVKFSGLIGSLIIENGHAILGREVVDTFSKLRISEQTKLIQEDITTHFWHQEAKLVAQSYGAYLLIHALIEMETPFPGKVLLLSPVLGASSSATNKVVACPPRHKKLIQTARENKLPHLDIEVHTGEHDNGCDPLLAQEIFTTIPTSRFHIVKNMGHNLEVDYVRAALNNFFCK